MRVRQSRSKITLCTTCSFLSASLPPHPLANTGLLDVTIVLPFLECHIVEIVQYAVFQDWTLSHNMLLGNLVSFSFLGARLFSITDYIPPNRIIRCLSRYFAYFFIGLFLLLLLSFNNSLDVSKESPYLQIFSPILWPVFSFL